MSKNYSTTVSTDSGTTPSTTSGQISLGPTPSTDTRTQRSDSAADGVNKVSQHELTLTGSTNSDKGHQDVAYGESKPRRIRIKGKVTRD